MYTDIPRKDVINKTNNNNTRICSFDIENMYTDIPREDVINKTNNILKNNIEIEARTRKEIIYIMRTIMRLSYFQFDLQYYEQTEGLAMGAPISVIIAEIFIQYLEHKYIDPIFRTREIIAYYRYIDDILIIYDQHKTNIGQTLEEFNNIQPSIKFTSEKEQEKINYLDITIHIKKQKIRIFNIQKTNAGRHHNTH
jgi:hypothetical protein